LKDEGDEMPYPSMPTAFLGSPTSYSPTFEHPSQADEPSMDLGEMIASLRSRCASLGSCHSSVTKTCDDGEPLHPSRVSMASFSEGRDDEWTFADTLTGTYGDKSCSNDTFKSNTDLEIGSPGGFETDTSVSVIHSASPKPNLQPTRVQLRRPSAQNFLEPATPPPTTPLPVKPAMYPTKHVRGILKSTKNVRFASLPDEDEDKRLIAPPRIPALQPVVLNPSPLRQSFEPAYQVISTATIIHAAPANTANSRATVPKTSAAPFSSNRAPSTRRASESLALRSIIRRPSIIVSSKTPTAPQSTASFQGRHSIGAKTGKQNRFRSSSTPEHPSRFVLDENTLKRAKEVNARESVSHKSRMPVSVRNIFTRFK
jgi:hypothetical protein